MNSREKKNYKAGCKHKFFVRLRQDYAATATVFFLFFLGASHFNFVTKKVNFNVTLEIHLMAKIKLFGQYYIEESSDTF